MTSSTHPPRRRSRRVISLFAGAAGIALLALGSGPAITASAAARHHAVSASEADNGKTVRIHRGSSLTLTLHSTYWTVTGSSNPAVLRERGKPAVNPAPLGAHCVPGQGCGTVSAAFTAMARGRADVTASRTSCGEAMRCTPGQGDYVIHVVVTG